MGVFTSCCRPSASGVLTPDAETRRRQQVEAAERRAAQEASRGIRDPDRMKRIQQRNEEMEQREKELTKQGGAALKVKVYDVPPSGLDIRLRSGPQWERAEQADRSERSDKSDRSHSQRQK